MLKRLVLTSKSAFLTRRRCRKGPQPPGRILVRQEISLYSCPTKESWYITCHLSYQAVLQLVLTDIQISLLTSWFGCAVQHDLDMARLHACPSIHHHDISPREKTHKAVTKLCGGLLFSCNRLFSSNFYYVIISLPSIWQSADLLNFYWHLLDSFVEVFHIIWKLQHLFTFLFSNLQNQKPFHYHRPKK